MATTDDDLIELERRAVAVAAGPYLAAIEEIRALLQDQPDKAQAAVLKLVAPRFGRSVVLLLAEAFGLGIADAAEVMSPTEQKKASKALALKLPSVATTRDVTALAVSSRQAVLQAQKMVRAGVDIKEAVAPVLADASRVTGQVTAAVNSARSEAVAKVSIAAELPMTIEAERDACVRCLAYAGKVSKDGSFPGGLTFGVAYPSIQTTSQRLPIHPRCRCRLVTLKNASYATALEREAKRSILRGYALSSEPESVRLKAAAKLLEKGSGMPKSVDAFARSAVKAGKFPKRIAPPGASLAGG